MVLPKTVAVLLLMASILNLPGLLRLHALPARILSFHLCFYLLFQVMATLQHKKVLDWLFSALQWK